MPNRDDITAQVTGWYGESDAESIRLSATAEGRLELHRTRELLQRHLPPPPARILDVGGGPGAHAEWLVKDGYTPHLVDPVQRHLDQAARRAGCTTELGDARHLTPEDASYDVVLLLGPLYHLLDQDDRDAALAEARRVVRPGGIVAAAAIGRYASLTEHAATGNLGTHPRLAANVAQIITTGAYDGSRGFTAAKFHTADELHAEMTAAGLPPTAVYSVEGPMWGIVRAVEQRTGVPLADDDPLMLSALEAARQAEQHPDLLAASSHLLAIASAAARTSA
ncbi:class I SAM-dependent methyltransferase [Streptacidiphilus sp. MAP5-52]|uniref:class I SAM-dependent methyltransferase n=1 Tax=Streptacidiphilus sp. MAP5-52 TaxID=3156267 RepID=UPI0035132CE4